MKYLRQSYAELLLVIQILGEFVSTSDFIFDMSFYEFKFFIPAKENRFCQQTDEKFHRNLLLLQMGEHNYSSGVFNILSRFLG